jgi:hypothetical protein
MQRRIFRVEEMFADRRVAAPLEDAAAPREAMDEYNKLRVLAERREEAIEATVHALERELALVRETIARNNEDLAALFGDRKDRRMARAAGELGASVDAREKATQKILQATEGAEVPARVQARPGYPRACGTDLRGLQFPRSRRPAHRQGDRDVRLGRGPNCYRARALQRL